MCAPPKRPPLKHAHRPPLTLLPALQNQETNRGTISAVADQRTLFELYYRGYKGAIDAGVGSFMVRGRGP